MGRFLRLMILLLFANAQHRPRKPQASTLTSQLAPHRRAVPEAEEGADKVWAKAGALGDELVVQVLLKKQESGLWRAKKLVVTTQRGGGQGVVVPPAVAAAAKAASAAKAVGRPRVTCADEAAGDEMLECARSASPEVTHECQFPCNRSITS